jgi:hypothetical protein
MELNPFGLLVLSAGLAGCFHVIQEALAEQNSALMLPDFSQHPDDYSKLYWANSASPATATAPLPPAAAAPPVSGLGKLPPAPIAQGGPAAAPPAAAAPPQGDRLTISRTGLENLLKASGGMTADGCLKTPVIIEGMAGASRVEAEPEWQPGAVLVFSMEPVQGAVQCVEFVVDRSSAQW